MTHPSSDRSHLEFMLRRSDTDHHSFHDLARKHIEEELDLKSYQVWTVRAAIDDYILATFSSEELAQAASRVYGKPEYSYVQPLLVRTKL